MLTMVIVTIVMSLLILLAILAFNFCCCACIPLLFGAICERCCGKDTKFTRKLKSSNVFTCQTKFVLFCVDWFFPLWAQVLFDKCIYKMRQKIEEDPENTISAEPVADDEENRLM